MSKSILVIDTPENCYNCGIRRGYSCGGVSGTFGIGKDIDDFRLHKPDWCPLRDLPERKDMEPGKTIIRAAQHEGWNMCIDEILKGVNESE